MRPLQRTAQYMHMTRTHETIPEPQVSHVVQESAEGMGGGAGGGLPEVLLRQQEGCSDGLHSLLHHVQAVAHHGLPRPSQVGTPLPFQHCLLLFQLLCSTAQLIHGLKHSTIHIIKKDRFADCTGFWFFFSKFVCAAGFWCSLCKGSKLAVFFLGIWACSCSSRIAFCPFQIPRNTAQLICGLQCCKRQRV